jgi:hypothetical protein
MDAGSRYQAESNKKQGGRENLTAGSLGFMLVEQLTDVTDPVGVVMAWFVPAV